MDNTEVNFDIVSLDDIAGVFEEKFLELKKAFPKIVFSRQTHVDLKTAFTEAVANADKHASEIKKHGKVRGRLFIDHKYVGFAVEDHGSGFDIDHVPVPDLFDMKASGRGVFIMKQVGDDVRYLKGRKVNVLTFRRYLLGQNASTREIDLLYGISEAVIRGVSLEELYQMILEQALKIFKVERASLLIYDEKVKRLKVIASRGLAGEVKEKISVRSGEGVSGYVFQHGRPLLIEDINKNRRGIEKKTGYKSDSFISAPMICSPLRLEEKPIGVINLTDRADGRKFTKKDLKLLSTIANQAMACLHIRDLMTEVKKSETLKQELELVRNIQTSYLPSAAPTVSGFDIAGTCDMAQSVGGDYYDYHLADDFLYLVVADVSGHDIKSALTMFNFRSQLKVLFVLGLAPDEILTRLNATLYDDLERSGHFVSAIVMRLNVKTAKYEMAIAGHYPPLSLDGGCEFVESGLVLGIERKEKYIAVSGQIEKGGGLVLFTDGVIEAMNQKKQFFGINRLKKMVADDASLPSSKLVSQVVDKVLSYRSAVANLDDITVVALKHV